MKQFNTVFNQLLDIVPYEQFKRTVGQHKSDWKIQKLDTWNHFVILLYAQALGRDSLREIETGLSLHQNLWHHLGINTVARSTLARMNSKRNSIVFEKIFYATLSDRKLYAGERAFTFPNELYALDSTSIELCLKMFDWAKFRKEKGAFKLHTLFDVRSQIPIVIEGTNGLVSDIKQARQMEVSLPAGSILVFDRGYLDYSWWKELQDRGYFFVTRPRRNTLCIVSKTGENLEKDILGDDSVWIGDVQNPLYPREMRRVRYLHPLYGELVFLTNNFTLTASEISLIYKNRWQIELFFKWIKQNLVIKSFLGTSKNAVMNQIWVAMTYYLIVSYLKFQTRYQGSVLELTWVLKECLLTRRSLIDLLSFTPQTLTKIPKAEFIENLTMF